MFMTTSLKRLRFHPVLLP